ncbi:MAG: STM4012 family radical SAM protein [Pirellulales bacterium]|nr:STM4012 family radical SAM protein [Pirellulales bacterium]
MSLLQTTTLGEFATYAYSYPHKSAYGRLSPPISINQIWQAESTEQLSLYLHMPFCEMRCGFCNLFTQSQPAGDQVATYLKALAVQMSVVSDQIPNLHFSQFAIGGGTPTFLAANQLETLFEQLIYRLKLDFAQTPTSIETSPGTVTKERLQLLRAYGIHRVSIGIQSFDKQAAGLLGRPQEILTVLRALELLSKYNFPVLNIDLIYGHPEQSLSTWLEDIRQALRFAPNELYLYPLYIRPQTGLSKILPYQHTHRVDLYQSARGLLLSEGYRQLSLRAFQKPSAARHSTYACQRDGMIGLGCGARSYTQEIHYATRFATTQAGIQTVLAEWIQQTPAEFALATHGIWLSREEQFRRYLILSLLPVEGVLLTELQNRFPDFDYRDLSGIKQLQERNWAVIQDQRLQLTPKGLQYSDQVAPLLYSNTVLDKLQAFVQFQSSREPVI